MPSPLPFTSPVPETADRPAFIIAEAGVNHNGDVALAHRLVDVAADAGVDAVKFQTWKTEAVIHRQAPTAQYQQEATAADNQFDMVKALELPPAAFRELACHAAERGILFLSTAFDTESLELLVDIGVKLLKVPSGEIDNFLLLRPIARTGLPVIVSTGMSALTEIARSLDFLRAEGCGPLCLLHCTSNYPAALADANLRAIATMQTAFQLPLGYSDHTLGFATAVLARALGAIAFEKHFTLDPAMAGPDHRASASPHQLRAYVEAIRNAELALGDGQKASRPSEQNVKTVARRGLYAKRTIAAGSTIGFDDIVALRPTGAISPAEIDRVIGRTARRGLIAGEMLNWNALA